MGETEREKDKSDPQTQKPTDDAPGEADGERKTNEITALELDKLKGFLIPDKEGRICY